MFSKILRFSLLFIAVSGNLSAIPLESLQASRNHNFPKFVYPYGLGGFLNASQAFFLYGYALYENPDIDLGLGFQARDIQLKRIQNLLVDEPACVGGIYGWIDGRIAHGLLLAKRTPALWDELTAEEQEKVDWLMRAMAIAGHFCMDDGNNFHQMVHGDGNFQKTWNPNHVEGYVGAVMAAALYFGADELNTIFHEFDFDTYMSKFTELGFMNIVAAWQDTPETKGLMMDGGNSVSNPDVNDSWGGQTGSGLGVRNDFTYKGEPLDNLFGIYFKLADRMYSHTVVSTIEEAGGAEIKILGEATGATISPYEGQVGMMYEFLSGDAEGLRSDAHYCFDGLVNNVPNRAIVQLFGGWPNSPEGDDLRSRMEVGVGDFIFKVTEGYQGFQHGHTATTRLSNLLNIGYESVITVYEQLIDFTPGFIAPAAPDSLMTTLSGNQIDLEWVDQSDDETGFQIFRSVGDGDWKQIGTVPANTTTYSDLSPTPGVKNAYRIRAVLSGSPSMMTNPAEEFIPDLRSSVIQLHPTDDSFVRYGVHGDENAGSGDSLNIKDAVGPEFERASIMKFNLGGIEGKVHQAILLLYTNSYGEASLVLSGTDTDDWTEADITANTMPAQGEVLARFDVVDGENKIDLTEAVANELSGDGVLSIILHDEDNVDVFVSFYSSEASQPPQLLLQMAVETEYLIAPLDGTFVQGGTSADSNFGSNGSLIVKDAGGPDFDRSTLLKFSLDGYQQKDVASAFLILEPSSSEEASLVVRSIADDAWSEETVTLNTAPEFGEVIQRFDAIEGARSIDLTEAVAAELAGDAVLSLAIQDEDDVDVFVSFHSDDTANSPLLALTVFEDPVLLPWGGISIRPGDQVIDPVFGSFEVSEDGWLRHSELGWINVSAVSFTSDMWLFSQALDAWAWTNESLFPVLYDTANNRWVYYFILEDIGGWLYDYSTGAWTEL